MDLLNLPIVMVEHIISFLTYDEMAKYRLVSRAFNDVCMRMLNRGFLMIERRHLLALKCVKSQLPRRESERRYHPLARHCDILTSVETRISMLNMTYAKFIDNGICCFIPGKVIDEIIKVLEIVENSKSPPRAHEVLQELRDISSMAIEHFDEKISPAYRKRLQCGTSSPAPRSSGAVAPAAIRQEMIMLRKRSVLSAKLSLYVASQHKEYNRRMLLFERITARQRRIIKDMTKKQKEQETAIADLKKRIEECDIKYSELTHTNQAAGGKAMAVSSANDNQPTQPLRHFSSQIKLDLSVLPIGTSKRNQAMMPNIKPRKTLIKLPSMSDNAEADFSNLPNTSSSLTQPASMTTRSKLSAAKIKDIADEVRHLCFEADNKLKRQHGNIETEVGGKKIKRE